MASFYLGFVSLGSVLRGSVLTKNVSTGAPQDSTTAPTYRIYDAKSPTAILATGTLSSKDPSATGGVITGATNATPIVVTSAGHGLQTGMTVRIAGVVGNTAANGVWVITVIDANTFSLNTSVGNGAYTSGGTWHVEGLYDIAYTVLGANGFASGNNYSMLVNFNPGGAAQADLYTFTVL